VRDTDIFSRKKTGGKGRKRGGGLDNKRKDVVVGEANLTTTSLGSRLTYKGSKKKKFRKGGSAHLIPGEAGTGLT